jgi:hypothetical protein
MQSVSGLSEKLDYDFRSIFEDTVSLDCLEFVRSMGLKHLNPDNLFDYLNREVCTPKLEKYILLEKKLCDNNEEWFVHCKMLDINGPFRVNRGARIKYKRTIYLQKSHNDLRNKLIQNKILVRDNNKLVFSRNYDFKSLSTAASVICGSNYNGWKTFKIAGTDQLAMTLRK